MILVLFLLLLLHSGQQAETCGKLRNFCDAYNQSSQVFLGTLEQIQERRGAYEYTFKIVRNYKGRQLHKITLPSYKAGCGKGLVLEKGESYLIYALWLDDVSAIVGPRFGSSTKRRQDAACEIAMLNKVAGQKRLDTGRCPICPPFK